ncbi:MAG TPA: FMN-binding negative transcriptional regulator [Chloroflexia bacterium]|nr:FMN-binding negative transcriptional regulator [Chloroflexia bacterium]
MYIPRSYREDDPAALQALMQEYNFATLVSQVEGQLFASHLPFLLDGARGAHGTLRGHMARANPQWHSFAAGAEVLVIFQGPHAYVSPSWYMEHPSVPTWNYAVVHAYGTPHLVDDAAALYRMLEATVQRHEAALADPWPLHPPGDYMRKMMQAIVGFEIPITRLEGKFKLSQNRAPQDQAQVVTALAGRGDPLSGEVARLMHQRQT